MEVSFWSIIIGEQTVTSIALFSAKHFVRQRPASCSSYSACLSQWGKVKSHGRMLS
jgi:hypothetical protein